MPASPRWDIFCRVVDNFGDAGVCWRLARQLAHEHGIAVTLWIDDPATLARIVRSVAAGVDDQQADRVRVRLIDDPAAAFATLPDVVIEGFGCGLPAAYLVAMVAAPRAPVWVVLEYLSAEPWIETTHGLPSPHPRLGIERWFWFPGFTERSGGLLRENLPAPPPGALATSTRPTTTPDPPAAPLLLEISVFCYSNPALPALFTAWAESDELIACTVPEGVARAEIERWSGHAAPAAGTHLTRGQLILRVEPFVDQPAYDRRLSRSALNFVRGEDSLVRAHWAARPFVWHVYPQSDDAHLAKMDAFLRRQEQGLPVAASLAQREFWYAWNAGSDAATVAAWPAFRVALPALAHHAGCWTKTLAAQSDMTTRLVNFCETRL